MRTALWKLKVLLLRLEGRGVLNLDLVYRALSEFTSNLVAAGKCRGGNGHHQYENYENDSSEFFHKTS